MSTAIRIPTRLDRLLTGSEYASAVKVLCSEASLVMQGAPVFFPEYTDHTGQHISDTLTTIDMLIPQAVFNAGVLNAKDIACLVAGTVLHDIGMHIKSQGFVDLLKGGWDTHSPDIDRQSWKELWSQYIRAVLRYDDRTLANLLGPKYFSAAEGGQAVRDPLEADPTGTHWLEIDKRVIGDFIRRHHPRLAHNIALGGFPGASGSFPELWHAAPGGIGHVLANLSGLVARSHGIGLRDAAELAQRTDTDAVRQHDVVVVYHMALLRLADYLQLDQSRAPTILMHLNDIQSPTSLLEWSKHRAIDRLNWSIKSDPLAIQAHVHCQPRPEHRLQTHLSLRTLLQAVQREFDTAVTVLRESYGTGADEEAQQLEIKKTRVISNLDDDEVVSKLPYEAAYAAFTTAGPDLLRLLIGPLYGHHPAPGLRELMQNSMDAVREFNDLRQNDTARGPKYYDDLVRYDLGTNENGATIDVSLSLDKDTAGKWWCTCTDRGVGMTPSIVRDYFLKAGASFRNTLYWKEQHIAMDGKPRFARAGKFGVGAFALFLLCDLTDDIKVTTRYYAHTRGVTFVATLDTDPIELIWSNDVPVGTQIRIPLNAAAIDALIIGQETHLSKRDACWDWCTSYDVIVRRSRDSKPLEQRHRWPSISAGDGHWRTTHENNGVVVDWAWGNILRSEEYQLAHNGLAISGHTSPPHGRPAWWSVRTSPPIINIVDSRGAVPITVTRTHLSQFIDECLPMTAESAARDLIAYMLVMLPEYPNPKRGIGFLESPSDEYLHLPIAATRNGWLYNITFHCPVKLTRDLVIVDTFTLRTEPHEVAAALFKHYDVAWERLPLYEPSSSLQAMYAPHERGNDAWCAHEKNDKILVRRAAGTDSSRQVDGIRAARKNVGEDLWRTVAHVGYIHADECGVGSTDLVHRMWSNVIGDSPIPFQLTERRTALAHAFAKLKDQVEYWQMFRDNGGWERLSRA